MLYAGSSSYNNTTLAKPSFVETPGLHSKPLSQGNIMERFDEYMSSPSYWEGVSQIQNVLSGMGMRLESMHMSDGMMILRTRSNQQNNA